MKLLRKTPNVKRKREATKSSPSTVDEKKNLFGSSSRIFSRLPLSSSKACLVPNLMRIKSSNYTASSLAPSPTHFQSSSSQSGLSFNGTKGEGGGGLASLISVADVLLPDDVDTLITSNRRVCVQRSVVLCLFFPPPTIRRRLMPAGRQSRLLPTVVL